MSQAGYTPIQLYYSTTASAAPSAGNLANGELALNITDGKLYYKDNGGVVRLLASSSGASGDVVGPASATDNALVRFDTTTGKLIQSSVGILSDLGVLTGLTGLTSSGAITFSSLTSGRVTYAGASGLLTDSANLTFNGTDLTVSGAVNAGTINATTLDLTNLEVTNIKAKDGTAAMQIADATGVVSFTSNPTLSGGTANGVAYLNGSKVLTTGSALTFDGTNLGLGTSTAPSTNGGGIAIYKSDYPRLTFRNSSTGDTNTVGVQFAAVGSNFEIYNKSSGYIDFGTGNVSRMLLDTNGNLGLGVTPSAWGGSFKALQVGDRSAIVSVSNSTILSSNYFNDGTADKYMLSAAASIYQQIGGDHRWLIAPSGTAGDAVSFTQAMTLDASGNLIVGDTTPPLSGKLGVVVSGTATACAVLKTFDASTYAIIKAWDTATTGNTLFTSFATDANNQRGEIYFNRAAGLTVYATTSDYRAKDILGPVTNSGALIDSVPVYMGKMHGATQERPMFIAHETPSYAHTGEKDAVDADGNPVFQQMDASALVPVMWAEIQSLRARVAALESSTLQ